MRPPKRRKRLIVTGTVRTEDVKSEPGAFSGTPGVRSVFVVNVKKKATEEDVSQWVNRKDVTGVISHPEAMLKGFT